MGCGGSKLYSNDEAVPPKIRPLLRHRFLETKKHIHSISLKGQTPSKKELLKNSVEEDDHSPQLSLPDNDNKSKSSRDGSINSAKVAPAPELGESKWREAKDVLDQQQKITKQEKKYNDKDKDVLDQQQKITKQEKKYNDKDKDLDSDEEEGRLNSFNDRLLCPGSPSFRVYCIDSFESDKDEGKDEETDEKLRNDDGPESVKSENSHEGSITKTQKKTAKGRRF